MSSLRNAIPRRPHKERAQEQGRARFGLLEKHKDYSKRARDFNEKKARLRILRQKATDRNPDEFHFAMMSSRSEGGVKVADRGNKSLSDTVTKLLKTQDAGYLRTMLNKVRKEKGKLEEETVFDADGGKTKALGKATLGSANKHTVYVDDESEQKDFTPEQWFGTDESGLSKTYNRPRTDMQEDNEFGTMAVDLKTKSPREREAEALALKTQRALAKKQKRRQEAKLAQYEAVQNREKELILAEQELDLQRAKMNHTVGGVNKNGVKFKVRERKR